MRKLLAIIVALVLVPIMVRMYASQDRERDAAPGVPEAVADPDAPTANDAARSEGVVYLDVRTPEEHAQGHVQGDLFIPVDQLEARLAELEPYRDRDVIVYCRSGRRAGIAIETLKAHGFTRLTNGGGLDELARTEKLQVVTE